MFPELFKIPGVDFTVKSYGVLLAIGFVSGVWLAGRIAEKDGVDRAKLTDALIYSLIASLVGSRLLLVITEWKEFAASPDGLFSARLISSGGVFYGGLLGAMLASVFLMRRYRLPWWRTADACAPGIAIGQFFGRLGCFAAGCCWGKPTAAWCGVQFSDRAGELIGVPTGVRLHPTQLYESLATLLLCLALCVLHGRRAFYGQVILAYLWGYGLIRFTIEFWRDDPRGDVWIFSTSQFIALMCSVFALAAILYLRRRPSSTDQPPPAMPEAV
jgi:phosphatidylglycerol:prolipoprotein diacylglycerol transferase